MRKEMPQKPKAGAIHDEPARELSWFRRLIHWVDGASDAIGKRLGQNFSDFFGERQLLVWLLALIIGIGVGYAALGFRTAIGAVQWLWLGTSIERVYSTARGLPWYVVLLAPVVGGLIVGVLLQFVVPGKRGQGVADVIEASAIGDCRISTVQGLWGAILSVLTLGFGASAGREGPMVHLGATIASRIEDSFRLSSGSRRTLLACGVAAAVSGSFNAPIAGVLFAHEVILAHYALRAFVPIVISSVIGAIIARVHFGNYAAFLVPQYAITSFWEFPAFALLGVTCAVVAVMFELSLMLTERVAWRITIPLWLRPVIGGLCVGAIAMFFPQVLGVGYDAIDTALREGFTLWVLLAVIVAKTAATAITLASRFAGGIFSPSLYLGAMTGSAFGIMAASVFPEISSSNGLYALLGAGAVAASVLGAPISSTMIVFELTGGYEMTIALLLTVSIAHGLTQAALGHSYFHWQLSKRGMSFQEGPHKAIMRRLTVSSFMIALEDDVPVPALPDRDKDPWLGPNDSLERALRMFDRAGVTRIPVVAFGQTREVVGWADRTAAISTFNRELIRSHEEAHK